MAMIRSAQVRGASAESLLWRNQETRRSPWTAYRHANVPKCHCPRTMKLSSEDTLMTSPSSVHLASRVVRVGPTFVRQRQILRCSGIASTQLLASDQGSGDRDIPSLGRSDAVPGAATEESEVLIELKDVYKSFGDKHILKGASFKIRQGEAVGIIGPSGTGKSTVLKVMAGLLAPDKGEVWITGKKRQGLLDDYEESFGLRIGLVFQSAALFDSLTVKQNVGFLLYEHSDLSEEEIEQRVRESLLAVGLKGVEERLPSELSGGMRKRVALARAIISGSSKPQEEREVVMYDEPTAGLDPIASTVVEDLIRSLHMRIEEGLHLGKIASYIVVTHQHSTIRRAVDRLLFLYDGQVKWEGTVEEFDTTDNPLVRQFAEGSLKGPIQYL